MNLKKQESYLRNEYQFLGLRNKEIRSFTEIVNKGQTLGSAREHSY